MTKLDRVAGASIAMTAATAILMAVLTACGGGSSESTDDTTYDPATEGDAVRYAIDMARAGEISDAGWPAISADVAGWCEMSLDELLIRYRVFTPDNDRALTAALEAACPAKVPDPEVIATVNVK